MVDVVSSPSSVAYSPIATVTERDASFDQESIMAVQTAFEDVAGGEKTKVLLSNVLLAVASNCMRLRALRIVSKQGTA
jgi:hypothetical protein